MNAKDLPRFIFRWLIKILFLVVIQSKFKLTAFAKNIYQNKFNFHCDLLESYIKEAITNSVNWARKVNKINYMIKYLFIERQVYEFFFFCSFIFEKIYTRLHTSALHSTLTLTLTHTQAQSYTPRYFKCQKCINYAESILKYFYIKKMKKRQNFFLKNTTLLYYYICYFGEMK